MISKFSVRRSFISTCDACEEQSDSKEIWVITVKDVKIFLCSYHLRLLIMDAKLRGFSVKPKNFRQLKP